MATLETWVRGKRSSGATVQPRLWSTSQQYHCFRLSNVSGFYHKLNINILLVEYRGYGLSEGSPSEHGLYLDAQAAFDYIVQRNDIDRTQIILFGRSLGRCLVDASAYLQNRFAY